MLRKIVFVLLALALPLVAASAASAQQYPPTGDTASPNGLSRGSDDPSSSAGGSGVSQSQAQSGSSSAPLARTGSDLVAPAGVAVVLLLGGAIAIVASRRRLTPATVSA